MENKNKQVQRMEQVEQKTDKNSLTSSKYAGGRYAGLGAALAAELMIGFWFGIGAILAFKTVSNLEYFIDELIRRKSGYCQ